MNYVYHESYGGFSVALGHCSASRRYCSEYQNAPYAFELLRPRGMRFLAAILQVVVAPNRHRHRHPTARDSEFSTN